MSARVDEVVKGAIDLFLNSRIGWVKYLSKTFYQEFKNPSCSDAALSCITFIVVYFLSVLTRIQYYNCIEDTEMFLRVAEYKKGVCSFEM
jgi:hypothetical protein